MATPNTLPAYTKVFKGDGVEVTAANTKSDGSGTIGTDIFLVGTVEATIGGFLRNIVTYITGTTAATASTATVVRYFWSEVSSGATTAANTHPLGEFAVASQSADNSGTATYPVAVLNFQGPIPAGASILVTNHAAPAANTKLKTEAFWGEYI